MTRDRVAVPHVEPPVGRARLHQLDRIAGDRRIVRVAKARRDLGDGRRIERECAVPDRLPFGLDLAAERFGAELVYQYLDARLVDVVAAAVLIIDAQDRLDIAQEIMAVHEWLDGFCNEWRAAKAAADQHLEASLAFRVLVQPQPDIVDLDRDAIVSGRGNCEFELARQEREFRMKRGVLPQQFGPDARIFDFAGRHSGPLIRRHVAGVIA